MTDLATTDLAMTALVTTAPGLTVAVPLAAMARAMIALRVTGITAIAMIAPPARRVIVAPAPNARVVKAAKAEPEPEAETLKRLQIP